jgi:NAD(P)-dependent dehydrogenase (short-subunit alcohol dehydrogenase family)
MKYSPRNDGKARAALVTGAGRGIGRAIAVALAERGWGVIVNYRSNAAAAEETLRLVESSGGQGVTLQADVGKDDDRRRLADEALRAFGRIDLLVNNAAMAPQERRDILETTEPSFDELMAVNLKGPFFLTQIVAKAMVELIETGVIPNATIINIGSVSAYASNVNRAEYCLSKAGLAMMTVLYADRLAEHGIGVFEVRPGIVRTDMTAAAKEKYDRLIAEGITPIKRWGEPGDVAQAVVAIAEGRFPFSTGEVINVDGGFHLRRL